MYHISLDTAATLSDVTTAFRYFGQIYRERPKPSELEHARKRFGEILGLAGSGKVEGVRSFHAPTVGSELSSTPGLFLDPLYVLFSDISDKDTVLLLDMSTVTNPDWHNRAVGMLYEVAFAQIARARPNLIAISRNTADAYVANFGYPSKPIQVVHLYVPEHLRTAARKVSRLHSPSPYFLFVGSLEARKNVTGAIQAFRISELAAKGYQLLIAGGHGHGGAPVEKLVRATPNVHLRGFVGNDELHALYSGASGFVYPSYLEGFGVPLLEAMSYGLPAVASFTGACPEVGGDIVSYVDPDDHAAIAAELVHIATLSPADRASIAARSQDWVENHFRFSHFQANLRRAVMPK
jgi:glycosyltransferase involved in cell wall biosynthesis